MPKVARLRGKPTDSNRMVQPKKSTSRTLQFRVWYFRTGLNSSHSSSGLHTPRRCTLSTSLCVSDCNGTWRWCRAPKGSLGTGRAGVLGRPGTAWSCESCIPETDEGRVPLDLNSASFCHVSATRPGSSAPQVTAYAVCFFPLASHCCLNAVCMSTGQGKKLRSKVAAPCITGLAEEAEGRQAATPMRCDTICE